MNRSIRVLSAAALVLVGTVAVPHTASAAVDTTCSYTKAKKLVTLRFPDADAAEGPVWFGRVPGSKRIGFDTYAIDWKVCGGATTDNTDKVKVLGSQQSEELVLTLEGGPLAPGRTRERTGTSEIELSVDLGDGTDELTLLGGFGADHLAFHSRSSASLNADSDADVALSGVDEWTMDGGLGNDVLDGHGAPAVTLYGREGSDRLTGGSGRDQLTGDEGVSTAADGNDVLNGGAGDDDLSAGGGNDRLLGGADDDYLRGDKGRDAMSGGSGDDNLYAESGADGADVLSGGSGGDTANYTARVVAVHLTLDGKANDGTKREKDLLRGDLESLRGGAKDDVIVGNGADNYLQGNDGNDTLRGLGGDDGFGQGNGDDSIFGGDGDDDCYSSAGVDRFYGEAGDDYVNAGSTNDGRDLYSGGSGVDTITYSQRTGAVTIDVGVDNHDGESLENDWVKADFESIYGGAGGDTISGGPTGEYIVGNAGNDDLAGGRGADTVDGGTGNDSVSGGEGYDSVYGGDNDDLVFVADDGRDYFSCGSGTDTGYVDAYDPVAADCEALVA
jgi:Ca2+-binding RTX toxin-like protein